MIGAYLKTRGGEPVLSLVLHRTNCEVVEVLNHDYHELFVKTIWNLHKNDGEGSELILPYPRI